MNPEAEIRRTPAVATDGLVHPELAAVTVDDDSDDLSRSEVILKGALAAGAPVVEPDQRRQALGDHVMGAASVQVGHEGDTAGVSLRRRVVQSTV